MKIFKQIYQVMLGFLFLTLINVFAANDLPSNSIFHSESLWINHNNKTLNLIQFRGRPTVISMVYLSCQHTCPLTVSKMKAVAKELGSLASNINFVLVSFDPKNDTPTKMKAFLGKNNIVSGRSGQWEMMTSLDETNLRELSGLIDFKYKKVSDDEFEHSLALVALNADGEVIGRIEGASMKIKELATIVRQSKLKH